MKSVNLLPADLRGTDLSEESPAGPTGAGGPLAFFILGALAVAVVALAGFVLASNSVKQSKADLAEVTARQAGIRQQVAALKPYADYRDLAQGRVESVRQLAESRFDWERALRDISRTLPASVTLEKLDASLGSGDSESSSPLRGAIEAPAIQLVGCTTDQRDVAQMMARLRGVEGVTRVSLAQSQKDDDAQGETAAASATGGAAKEAPCGRGSHPEFDVVIFFERDAALSAAPNAQGRSTTGAEGEPTPSTGSDSTPPSSAATTTQEGGTP